MSSPASASEAKNGIFLGMMLARAMPGIALSLPLFILFARLGLSDTRAGHDHHLRGAEHPLHRLADGWLLPGHSPRNWTRRPASTAARPGPLFSGSTCPLALPGAAAAGIFAFLTSWNEFALASVITRTPASRTFPPALFEFTGQFVSDWRGMTAMSVLMLIPAMIFVALVQRQLMEGLTSGATKG